MNKENTNKNVKKYVFSNYEFNIIFNNNYFVIDLNTGEIANRHKAIDTILISNQDRLKIKKSFYKNGIDTLAGEIHVFNENNFTSIKNEEIIIIKKNNIHQSFFYVQANISIENVSESQHKNIILFYEDIKTILMKYSIYNNLHEKEKMKDNSIGL